VVDVSLGKHNVLVVMLMLLVFVGQVVASAINTCPKGSTTEQNSGLVAAMTDHSSHSNHNISASVPEADPNLSENCKLDCYCSLGGCASVAISTLQNNDVTEFLSQKINQTPFLALTSQIPSSLFRPPISRS